MIKHSFQSFHLWFKKELPSLLWVATTFHNLSSWTTYWLHVYIASDLQFWKSTLLNLLIHLPSFTSELGFYEVKAKFNVRTFRRNTAINTCIYDVRGSKTRLLRWSEGIENKKDWELRGTTTHLFILLLMNLEQKRNETYAFVADIGRN